MDQSNPFVQLVSGVVWLLRNGEVYINHSLTAECDKTQETGTYPSFTFTNNKQLPVSQQGLDLQEAASFYSQPNTSGVDVILNKRRKN